MNIRRNYWKFVDCILSVGDRPAVCTIPRKISDAS